MILHLYLSLCLLLALGWSGWVLAQVVREHFAHARQAIDEAQSWGPRC